LRADDDAPGALETGRAQAAMASDGVDADLAAKRETRAAEIVRLVDKTVTSMEYALEEWGGGMGAAPCPNSSIFYTERALKAARKLRVLLSEHS